MVKTVSGQRQFGAIRPLASGKYQVRYRDRATGQLVPAQTTFGTKKEASLFLSRLEADQHDGNFLDPNAGKLLWQGRARNDSPTIPPFDHGLDRTTRATFATTSCPT